MSLFKPKGFIIHSLCHMKKKYAPIIYSPALEDFNKSIKINPRLFRKSLLGRGDSKLKLDDFKGAIVDYNKVIELDPKNKEALQNRSIAKIKLESVSEN